MANLFDLTGKVAIVVGGCWWYWSCAGSRLGEGWC